MHHPLTLNAAFTMLAGAYMVLQFGWVGCRLLESADTLSEFRAFKRSEKIMTIVCGLLVVAGIDMLAIASPYAEWSTPAIVVASIGTLVVIGATVVMIMHLNASGRRFPTKQFAIDMVAFCGGLAIVWVSMI